MKTVIILRGVSGCGKTTFAKSLVDSNTVICTADDYFVNNYGQYEFLAALIHEAHKCCKEKFLKAIAVEAPRIIVANTNTTQKEFEFYEENGKNAGYRVFSVIIENRHGNTDIHNVPDKTKDRQKQNILNSISL